MKIPNISFITEKINSLPASKFCSLNFLQKSENDYLELSNNKSNPSNVLDLIKNSIKTTLKNIKNNNEKRTILTLENFRENGGKFEKGKALLKNNKKYNGTLTLNINDKKYALRYQNGLLITSEIDIEDTGIANFIKNYTYDGNKELTNVLLKKSEGTEIESLDFDDEKISKKVYDFQNTQLGKNRSKLSDDEIYSLAQEELIKSFKKRNLDPSLMPKLEMANLSESTLGNYEARRNIITINVDAYKNSDINLEETIEHEMTHFEKAIFRACISKEKQKEIIENALLAKINGKEAEKVAYDRGMFFVKTVYTPKMSDKMKKELSDFISSCLYDDEPSFAYRICNIDAFLEGEKQDNVQREIVLKVKKIIDDNPEFIEQYKSKEDAIKELTRYCVSHTFRYSVLMNNDINVDYSKLPILTFEQTKEAEEVMEDFIECSEGNLKMAGIGRIFGNREDFNSYQFSKEEVLAEINGNNNLIQSLEEKMANLKKEGKLTPALSANYNDIIEKAYKAIIYKKAGLNWYEKYSKFISEPENTVLAKEVEMHKKLLDELKRKAYISEYSNGTYYRYKTRK